MIKIRKVCPPEILRDGEVQTRSDCAAYDRGERKFDFKQGIYGHQTVKKALKLSQYQKCCYCEGQFAAYAPGDIEHYRPKGAVRQDNCSERLKPGYFWLAYSWKNLYWSCEYCNRSHKKDFFPLRNPDHRARSHNDNLEDEIPLILDPGGVNNPREHIKFYEDMAISDTELGKVTIDFLGLNRYALRKEREKHLELIRALIDIICLQDSYELQPNPETNSKLQDYTKLTAKFSAMTNDYLQANGLRIEEGNE